MIGKMPLELDILIFSTVPTEKLPYPFNYLGKTTIAELKGPGNTATWREIAQVENYGCLYQLRKAKTKDRGKITLWLIASKFSSTFNRLRKYSYFFSTIHTKRLKEVLDEMDLRNLRGLDLDLPAIIDLFGREKVIETIGLDKVVEAAGREKVIETIGLDNVIETAGQEKVLATIFPNLTKEQIKKMIEQNGNR